jgi:protease II
MKKFLTFLAIGVLGTFLVVHIYLQGYVIFWQHITKPPEKPVQIASINDGLWIKSESGFFYYISNDKLHFCKETCWQKFDNAPSDSENIYPGNDYYGYTPSVRNFSSSRIVFESYGPAGILRVYAIDSKGEVYLWENEKGDFTGVMYVYFPALVGITIILGFIFYWVIITKQRM